MKSRKYPIGDVYNDQMRSFLMFIKILPRLKNWILWEKVKILKRNFHQVLSYFELHHKRTKIELFGSLNVNPDNPFENDSLSNVTVFLTGLTKLDKAFLLS